MTRSNLAHLPQIAALTWDDCRLMVDSVTDYAMFMLDVDGRIATWNRGAERIKGYTTAEIVGQHFSKFYRREDVAAGKPEAALEAALRSGSVEDEGWRVRKDGSQFWANVVLTVLRSENGTVRGYAKVTRDLTDRRRAEEELHRSEQRFHHLLDSVTDYAIFMLDENGNVASWNAGARLAKGYEADEIVGRHFSVFYTAGDRAAGRPDAILEKVRRDGRFEEESWRIRKDGKQFWASVVITALRDATGHVFGFAKVTRDLTKRREAEQNERRLVHEEAARAAAEAVAKRAEEANRIKDEFLATVSHELRTPLNAIVGWTALLRQQRLDPRIEQALEVIDRNAKAQVKIVDDLLDVSRIITGKLRIDAKPIDIVVVAREAMEIVGPSVKAKRLTLTLEASEDVVFVLADAERMQQVIWNLLCNAVKFTDAGGSIVVRIEKQGSHVELSVADTGRGIEPDFLPSVFDRFQQADASTTRRFGGLGLGLALVRHIVELHGGTVGAESAGAGAGATFRVTLPVRALVGPIPPAPSAGSTRAPTASTGVLRGVRLLIVDDDVDSRTLLATFLADVGAEVAEAGSAREAMTTIRAFRPHVLISDIGMPDEDGYSFVRRVRALGPDEGGAIPAIALTAYTRAEDRAKALAAGFTAHIGKPVQPGDLVTAVATLAAFVRQ